MQDSASFLTLLDKSIQTRLYYKFKSVMGFTDLAKDCVIAPKSIAQRRIAEKRGNNVVEFFNVWRDSSVFAKDRQRVLVGQKGIPLSNPDGGAIKFYKMAPSDLTYRFWIWSQSLNKLNKCVERFWFWLYNNPKLDMLLDGKYPISHDLLFADYASEHQLEEQYDKGIVYVNSFELMIRAWVMDFSSDAETPDSPIIKKIHLSINDNTNDPEYVELSTEWLSGGKVFDIGTGTDVVSRVIISP